MADKKYFNNTSEIYLDPSIKKKCCRCHKTKTLDHFFKNCYAKTGVSSFCKSCNKKKMHKFRSDNPEYDRNHYEKNKEYRSIFSKYYHELNREANKEKCRNHYEKNRNNRLKYAKKHKQGNRTNEQKTKN